MDHPDEKKLHIIDFALRRFAHFGIQKTTMNEIAEDMGISKANLYYYFSDKTSLVADTVHLLLQQARHYITQETKELRRTEDMLFRILEIKKDYLKKFHMLHMADAGDINYSDDKIQQLVVETQEQDVKIIACVLEKGMNSGELVLFDALKMAQLYMETVRGLFLTCNINSAQRDLLEEHQLNEMLEKQKEVTRLFINGLKQPLR